MEDSISRRSFLAGSARLAAWVGAGAAAHFAECAAAEKERRLPHLGVRDAHLKETGEKDCWSAMKAIGAEGVEARVADDLSLPDLFHPERKYSLAGEVEIGRIAADLKASGLRISAFCTFNRFDERPEFELEWSGKAARAAKALEVPVVRIDVWPHKLSGREFLEFAIETLKKLIAATEPTGVAFGIENHGAVTNDPEFLTRLFAGVGSKRLGLTLDTGNFYWFGHPLSKVYELYEAFAPRVLHTHCKSIRYPEAEREKRRAMGWEYEKYNCPIDEGDIDFRRVVKTLLDAGYANALCVEDESLGKVPAGERGTVLAREIRHLKGILTPPSPPKGLRVTE